MLSAYAPLFRVPGALRFIAGTALSRTGGSMFGVAVINATSFLYSQIELRVATAPGALIYTITGAHLAMVVVGLVFLAVMVFRTLGGEYAGRDREGLVAAALFWFVTIAVHAVIWYVIYILK